MALNKPFVVVTMKPRNLGIKLSNFDRKVRKHYRRFVESTVEFTKLTMKDLVPVNTGRLRESIIVIQKNIADGGTDLRSNAIVGSLLRYASFVDKGTKPSSGRYVPFLGRRLTTGIHPGTPPAGFIQGTKDRVDQILDLKGKSLIRTIQRDFDRIR